MKKLCNMKSLGGTALVLALSLALWCFVEGVLTVGSFLKSVWLEDGRAGQLNQQPLIQWDAELGWAPLRSLDRPDGMGPGRSVRTDAQGRRLSPFRAVGKPIVCSGDSFTFGEKVSDGETWCALLGRSRVRPSVNLGVSGYGLDQSFLRFRSFTQPYSTHVVGLILDDLTRMLSQRSPFGPLKPTVRLENEVLVAKRQWLSLATPLQWLLRRIHLADRLPSVRLLAGKTESYTTDSSGWERLLALTGHILRNWAEHAQKKGAGLMVVLFPTRHDMIHGRRLEERRALRQVVEEQGIAWVDTFPHFEKVPLGKIDLVFYRGGHFTAEGHRQVAGLVTKALGHRAQRLVKD